MSVNRISITITDADKTAVSQAATTVANLTEPWQVPISKEEKASLPKMSDGSIAFVEKVALYAVSNPEFLQPFANVAEFNKDFKAFADLREIVRPLRQTVDNLENSLTVAGSEAWQFALNYYKMVQHSAKMGIPGAQAIYDDLRQRFEKRDNKPAPTT